MGLLSKLGEMRMKEPVEGVLTVVGISNPDPTATSSNYRLDGVVTAAGLEATAIVHHGMASVGKWPSPGDQLPVTVDRAKPDRIVIHWDSLQTGRAQAQSAAQALAEQMRAGGTSYIEQTAPSNGATSHLAANAPEPATVPFVGNTDPALSPRPMTAADILARGTAGTARIDAVFPSAEAAAKPNHTLVGLQITVSIPGHTDFQCKNLYGVPNDKVAAMVVGMTLPVKADLSTPGAVAVDWTALSLS